MIQGTENTDRIPAGRQRRWWRVPLALALLAAVAAWFAYPTLAGWWRSDLSVSRQQLRFGTISRADLERDLAVEGRVVAAFHPTLYSPARAEVRLQVQPGEVVHRGQPLAELISPELQSRLAQEQARSEALRSELERGKLAARADELASVQRIDLLEVQLQAARRQRDRLRTIHQQGVVGTTELERAEDELEITRLELQHARSHRDLEAERLSFELRQLQADLQRQSLAVAELQRQVRELVLLSPVDGQVASVEVQDRDAVSVGQAVLQVVDLSAFEVEAGIPEAFAAEVQPGTTALVRVGERNLTATVRRIAPEVEGTVVAARLAFDDPQPQDLRQSQRLQVRLVLQAKTDVLQVERGPFLQAEGGHYAYVVQDDLAHRRRIRTGLASVEAVEILDGLEVGETIVLSDTTRFRAAESVLLRR